MSLVLYALWMPTHYLFAFGCVRSPEVSYARFNIKRSMKHSAVGAQLKLLIAPGFGSSTFFSINNVNTDLKKACELGRMNTFTWPSLKRKPVLKKNEETSHLADSEANVHLEKQRRKMSGPISGLGGSTR